MSDAMLKEIENLIQEKEIPTYPRLTETDIETFHKQYGVELPAEYMMFLTTVGDGWKKVHNQHFSSVCMNRLNESFRRPEWLKKDFPFVDSPEQVTTAFVSQTRYRNVRDDHAVYFFKEEAEAPVLEFCGTKEYILDQRAALEMPGTSHTWTADDGLKKYLLQSGAYVRLTLWLEDDLDTETYAEQVLDFLNSAHQLGCNLFFEVRANKTYIFFSEFQILDGFDASIYSLEKLEKRIEESLKTGDPR